MPENSGCEHHGKHHGEQNEESHEGHSGACGCGGHGHHGSDREGQPHAGCNCQCHQHHDGMNFQRHFISREEIAARLEEYLKKLQAEAKGVEERIAELKKESKSK